MRGTPHRTRGWRRRPRCRAAREARRPTGVPRPPGVGAVGVLFGAQVQDWLERTVGPDLEGRHRALGVPADRAVPHLHRHRRAPSRRARADVPAKVRGLVDHRARAHLRRPPRDDRRPSSPATSSASPAGACPTCTGRACSWRDAARPGGRASREAKAVRFTSLRRHVHREPHARPGAPQRRARRVRARGRRPLSTRPRRPGAALRRTDVRLQVVQVARRDRAHRPRSCPGYWEHHGYDVDAWVGRSNGRDDEPPDAWPRPTGARRPAHRASTASSASLHWVERDAVRRR